MNDVQRRVLSRAQAAEYLGLSVKTLAQMAWRGDGPAFARTEPRGGKCLYRVADLDAWIDERAVIGGAA